MFCITSELACISNHYLLVLKEITLTTRSISLTERDILFSKVEHLFQTFSYLDKEEKFIFLWTVKASRYLPGLVNLYIAHLKQEMKSWYNFVTGYNSQSSADKYLLLISISAWTYVCVLIRAYLCVCMHVYICMCIYMGSIYIYVYATCLHTCARTLF